MSNYEFIKYLSKEDMSLFLTAFCGKHSYHGMKVTDFKQSLLKSVRYLLAERGEKYIAQPIMTYEFLSQEYERKEVYKHICSMTIEEMSGVFGLLSVSDTARLDVIYGDIPNYVLSGKRRPCQDMIEWLSQKET